MTGTPRQANARKPTALNEPSRVLSQLENDKLFSLLGNRCQTLASAVVQVFLADPPSRDRWNKRHCGVATLIKDNPNRSYFIRVYDIRANRQIWEQEMYNDFKYKTPRPHFHTFDTDNCPAGLNFTNVEEAQIFRDAIQQLIQKRNMQKGRNQLPPPPTGVTPSNSISNLQAPLPKPNSAISKSMTNLPAEGKKGKKDKKKNKKLTKDDIGCPTGFTHLSHIGWDPNNGYDTNNLDPSLKDLFDAAGVSSAQLEDKETANFIYDFIEKRGGVDAVKQQYSPSKGSRGKPPPPPMRGPAVPPPSRGPVPPPPSRSNAPPPPPMGGAPAPPPPPPVGGPAPPPPPPVATPGGKMNAAPKPAAPSLSSALQDQIHRGMKLKPVDASQDSKPAGGRNALMSAIQKQDFSLKPAPVGEVATPEPPAEGLAGALAKALALRNVHIHDSAGEDDSSDEDEEFDNDEDWD